MSALPEKNLIAPEATALAKARRRLLPLLFVLYVVAYVDRINVGFAALEMNRALGLTDAVYGFGAGLFFAGYFIFEIPSNLILARVGARRWIARIMISWGIVAIAMMEVRGAASFYLMRFLLGVAEAGFFPGVILYLTFWFPAHERARAIALFMTAAAIAGIVAGPISGAILTMHGALGLAGWQWLFVLEGVPAIVLGIVVAARLPDGPDEAAWLSGPEHAAIAEAVARDSGGVPHALNLKQGFADPRVWLLAAIYFGTVFGVYGVSFWLPQIIKGFHQSGDFVVGLLAAIPFVAAAIAMVWVGRISDRTGNRALAVALSVFAGAAGFALAAIAPTPALELAAITIGAAGIFSACGPFWAVPSEFLSGSAAACGIALINSVGNLGGFFGPYAVGLVREATRGFSAALAVLAIALAAAGVLALVLRRFEHSSRSVHQAA